MQDNGQLYRGDLIDANRLALMLNSSPIRRGDLMPTASRRDIDHECDFQKTPWTPYQYYDMWDKEPIAARICEGMPEEAHSVPFSVFEKDSKKVSTAFEKRFQELGYALGGPSWYRAEECNPLVEHIERWQVLSRIGRYGAMLVGTDDGRPLNEPAAGVEESNSSPLEQQEDGKWVEAKPNRNQYKLVVNAKPRQLTYLREFPEVLAQVTAWEWNRSSPRYGSPLYYQLTFNGLLDGSSSQPNENPRVHWSRVLHHAGDNQEANPWIGHSCLRQVRNNLHNIRKLHAGPESVWKNGLGALHFGTHPQLGPNVDLDSDELMLALENMWNSLQPGLATSGLEAQALQLQVTDPTPQLMLQVKQICARTKYPITVLLGSELGGISKTSQDDERWQKVVRRYRLRCTNPRAVAPLVDRFVMLGILPAPEQYKVAWPVHSSLTELERADLFVKRTGAWSQYIQTGVSAVVPPMTFATEFDSMEEAAAEAMLKDAEAEGQEPEYDLPTPADILGTEGGTGNAG